MKRNDLVGKVFGQLTVKEFAYVRNRQAYFNCICICGKEKIVRGGNITTGHTKSCGCLKINDIIGQVFGQLTVKEFVYIRKRLAYFNCICVCGKETIVRGINLTSNHTKSCGHLQFASKSETAFLNGLEEKIGFKIERQFCIHTGMTGRRYYDGRVIGTQTLIEVDGSHWHKEEQKANDTFKESIAAQEGYNLIRVIVNDKSEVEAALKNFDVSTIK